MFLLKEKFLLKIMACHSQRTITHTYLSEYNLFPILDYKK